MNELEKPLMEAPDLVRPWCVVCGRKSAEKHHVVFRSHGGSDGPVLSLCGWGNSSGCHGLAHSYMLHFRYSDRWQYLKTRKPIKYQNALEKKGWRDCASFELCE